jgi:hypothetical protein
MVGLDRVVRVPLGDMLRRWRRLLDHAPVNRRPIGHDLDRRQPLA